MFGKLFQNTQIGALALAMTTLVVTTPATAEDEGADLARGETLFELCVQCHGYSGEGNAEALAPAIAGMPAWYVEAQLKNFKLSLIHI